jgi:voltage-gated potassium channel
MDTVPLRRAAARTTAVVSVLLGAFFLLPFRGDRTWLAASVGGLLLVAIVPVTFRRFRKVLVSEHPVVDAAEALLQLVTMLIVGFAALYFAMDAEGGQFSGIETRVDAIYFTVTTLATVGYGDITASSQEARLAVTFQMLFDLAFLGVAVRVLGTAARRER